MKSPPCDSYRSTYLFVFPEMLTFILHKKEAILNENKEFLISQDTTGRSLSELRSHNMNEEPPKENKEIFEAPIFLLC